MNIRSALDVILSLARVALAAGALVLIPAADAIVCAADEIGHELAGDTESDRTAALVELAAPGHQAPLQGDSGIDHCVHGHCHHLASSPRNEAGNDIRLMTEDEAIRWSQADMIVPRLATGLDRPPKDLLSA